MCWRLLAEFSSIGGVYGTHYVMIGWKYAYACRSEAPSHPIPDEYLVTKWSISQIAMPLLFSSDGFFHWMIRPSKNVWLGSGFRVNAGLD
ncbi:hypothetical protein JB92DRAFT_2897720 [Gautieria morchelliformis]|nr:hypothetical protein JB92DRAFT_2897720 [Gautieria morchelliformis]